MSARHGGDGVKDTVVGGKTGTMVIWPVVVFRTTVVVLSVVAR
jgi:hypothetical protein